jgi:hypothetical protein
MKGDKSIVANILKKDALAEIFDFVAYTKHADYIFTRAFKS